MIINTQKQDYYQTDQIQNAIYVVYQSIHVTLQLKKDFYFHNISMYINPSKNITTYEK